MCIYTDLFVWRCLQVLRAVLTELLLVCILVKFALDLTRLAVGAGAQLAV